MPRPERRLDPGDGAVQRFALALRGLREEAGTPGYRQMARTVHYSVTALSDAAGGRKLPSLAVTLAYVRACGGDAGEWESRWRAVAAELADVELAEPDRNQCAPYPGLSAFQREDADRFFGRSRLVGELVDALTERRFLAVFGPSGCGKSSLLRAGVVPAMTDRDDRWPVLLFTPGERPLEECATQLARLLRIPAGTVLADLWADPRHLHLAVRQALAEQPAGVEVLIVVDQFEEVFTLCQDDAERAQFIAALLAAAQAGTSRARVVLGVRADFYARCAEHPDLVEALRAGQTLIGGMDAGELREAIVQPAVRAGLTVENTLVTTIVAEVVGRPGALPSMSHALLETWRRRRGTTLALAGYQVAGGVEGALAQSAERVYRAFDEDQRQMVREIFLRLTAIGKGTEDTRRRVRRSELATLRTGGGEAAATRVLDGLVRARLVTADHETVEIAHEALIRSWPRLRDWLAEDRDGLRLHRQLTEAAQAWEALDRDPGALYRGLRLALTTEWDARTHALLTPGEREFLDTSVVVRQQELRTSRRRARRLRGAFAGLALVLVVGIVAAVVGLRSVNAAQERQDADLSRVLAARSTALAGTQPEASITLALRAFDEAPTAEARSALLTAQANPLQGRMHGGPGTRWMSTRYSPDGRVLAAGSTGGDVELWDTRTHTPLPAPGRLSGSIRALAFSPDSRTLAFASGPGTLVFWDIPSRTERRYEYADRSVGAVAFSPDGRTLAVAGTAVTLWDVIAGRAAATLPPDGVTALWGAAFSPDGRTLATGDYNGTVTVWDPASRQKIRSWQGQSVIRQLAFAPDGRTLATASYDADAVQLWDPATGQGKGTVPAPSGAMGVAFSPDGRSLAVGGDKVVLWDVDGHRQRATWTGHRAGITDVAFSPDGRQLATASEDSTVALWNAATPLVSTGASSGLRAIALGPDGGVTTTARDGTVDRWAGATGAKTAVWQGKADTAQGVTAARDGNELAAVGFDGRVTVWSAARGWQTPSWLGGAAPAAVAALSPDGRTLVTVSEHNVFHVWDIAQGREIAIWPVTPGYWVSAVAFSPDGRGIATTDGSGAAALWDLAGHRKGAPQTFGAAEGDLLAFAPDDRTVAFTAADNTVRLRDAATGSDFATLAGRSAPAASLVFSPDGTELAIGTVDGVVHLWDLASRTEIATLTGHTAAITAMTFGQDGRTLATAGDDGVARMWDLDTVSVTSRLCANAQGGISADEWNQLVPEVPFQPVCR